MPSAGRTTPQSILYSNSGETFLVTHMAAEPKKAAKHLNRLYAQGFCDVLGNCPNALSKDVNRLEAVRKGKEILPGPFEASLLRLLQAQNILSNTAYYVGIIHKYFERQAWLRDQVEHGHYKSHGRSTRDDKMRTNNRNGFPQETRVL